MSNRVSLHILFVTMQFMFLVEVFLEFSDQNNFGVFAYISETANVSEVSTTEACVQSSAELRQHVTFPNHFQVPEALKSGLTFGSFDTSGSNERSSCGTGGDNNTSSLESSLGNTEYATSRFVIHMLPV